MESSPEAIYRAEKDKALRERRISHLQLMQEAQEAFRKMLADAQLARKGGRPKSANTQAAQAAAAKRKAAAAAAAANTQTVADVAPVTVTAIPQPTVTKAAKVAKKEPARAAVPTKRKPEPTKRVASVQKAAAPSKQAVAKKAPAKQAAARKPAAAQRAATAAPARKKTTVSKSASSRSRAGGAARKGGR